jgi:hypothetical protein
MPITYTWSPTTLIGYPEFQGKTDVVTTAFYIVTANDGKYTSSNSSIQQFVLDPEAPFIPYNDLTPQIVTGWIQSALGPDGVASIYANLNAQIEAQINPPVTPVNLPLPWVEKAVVEKPDSKSITKLPSA